MAYFIMFGYFIIFFHLSGLRAIFERLKDLPASVFYAVRYKGAGLLDWRFHPIPDKVRVLYKNEGLTLDEFVFIIGLKNGSETTQMEKDDKIPEHDEISHSIPLELPNRRVAG